MASKALVERLISLILDQPGVKLMEKRQSACGRCKRRVKITRIDSTLLVLGVTEPDYPRFDLHVGSADIAITAAWMHDCLQKEKIEVFIAR